MREAEDCLGKILLRDFGAGAARKFTAIDRIDWREREVALAGEDHARFDTVDQLQRGEGAALEFKRAYVFGEREVFDAERIAKAGIPQFSVGCV